jgi:large subunit ribosomal protein L24
MKIKKGDVVIVRSGKDKGKEGKVIRAFPKKSEVLVEGVHVVTRHQKSKRRGTQGQLVHKPMPLPISVVALKDAKTGKASRVGYKMDGEGEKAKKVRITKKSGEKA